MTQQPLPGRVLPDPVSAIRLTYHCEQGWWDTGRDEPEIWHVSADLYDYESEERAGHVGDFEFFRADPYSTRDLFGVLDGYGGGVGSSRSPSSTRPPGNSATTCSVPACSC
ncbi:hypothetical protein AB0M19_34790 [Streptomyces sp. NPDC051920]|uniref:hypothetical protein n=1 Tax=Streptomyces sp. NPDC051920 TaxID=3155523 RepID=UPI0034360BCD